MPRVSVVLPSYNHGKFVEKTIRSVLEQDFADLEVIVCDDASTDDSLAVLHGIKDPRLTVLAQPKNTGAAVAAQRAQNAAQGEYIARICSDDLCLPGRITRQVAWLDNHPQIGCVLGLPEFIDESGKTLENAPAMAAAFLSENRSRQDWLRHFFDHGNAFCLPTAMLRRSTLAVMSPYKPMFHHLPDFEFWVRFCLKFEVHILPEKIVGFRIFSDGANLSAPDTRKAAAAEIERLTIWRLFLQPEALEALGYPHGPLGRLALANHALTLGGRSRALFAMQTIMETDLTSASEEEKTEFLRRAQPILAGNDALSVMERRRLREARDAWKEKHRAASAELETIRKSWLGRFLGKPR